MHVKLSTRTNSSFRFMLVAILGTSLACLPDTQAGTLSVTNGSFTNLTGLTGPTAGVWYGGVPAGWSSAAATSSYTVRTGGTNYANLQTLGPSSPSFNPLRQNVGTVDITSDIILTFTQNSLSGTSGLGSGIYDLASPSSALASYNSGPITSASTVSYTARGVGPGTSLYIAFWNSLTAAGISGVSIADSATTYAWNGGASGVWTNGGGGWTDTFDNTATTYNNAKPVVAQFTNAAAGTNVSVGGNVVVGNIQVSGANYDFSGGTITMTNTTWSVGAGQTASVGSTLAGTTGLTKADSGTLTLSASNSYSGGTTLSLGTLALGNANALGSGNLTVNGGTLDLGGNNLTAANLGGTGGTISLGANTLTASMTSGGQFNGTISGSGGLVKTGANYLTLAGSNSYTGGTTISDGTLFVSGSGTLGDASGAITISNIASTATLDLRNAQTRTGTITMIGQGARLASGDVNNPGSVINNGSALEMGGGQITVSVSGTGGLNVTGGGTINSSNSYTGATTISGTTGWYGTDQLFVNNANALGAASGDLTISGGRVNLQDNTISRSGNVTISGGTLSSPTIGTLEKTGGVFALQGGNGSVGVVLAGTAGLTKSGAGTNYLYSSNTYTGATTISGGTLVTDGAGQLTAGTTLAISNGATWQMTGTFSSNGATRTIGGLTGDGTVQTTTSGFTHNLAVDKASGTTDTFSGVIAGSGALVKQGAGTLGLGGANTYSGGTLVSAGVLRIGNSSALGSTNGGTVVESGAQLRLITGVAGATSFGNGEALTISGNGGSAIGALRSGVSGETNTYQGKVTLAANATINAGSGTGLILDVASGDGVNLGSNTLTFVGSGTHAVNDGIVGTGGLIKEGAGTTTLAAANAYSGATTVNLGTLKVASGGSISSSSTTVNTGGTFDVGGTAGNVQVNSGGLLKGSGSVGAFTLASGGTLTPGNSPGTLTAASATILGGSTYNWEISALTGTAGTTWDLFSVTGLLDMSGVTDSNKWNLVVTADGAFAGWTDTSSYSYVFAQAASVSGFDSAVGTDVTSLFNITTSGIASKPNVSFNPNGDFKVLVGSANGFTTLNLMAVPEPSTGSMLGLGLAGLVVTRLLRRKSS
jgi:autotransporter-associated beta strand protein